MKKALYAFMALLLLVAAIGLGVSAFVSRLPFLRTAAICCIAGFLFYVGLKDLSDALKSK